MRKYTAFLAATTFAFAGATALSTPTFAQHTPVPAPAPAPGATAPTAPSDTRITPNATQPVPGARDTTAATLPGAGAMLTTEQQMMLRQALAKSSDKQPSPNSAGWIVGSTVPAAVDLKAFPSDVNLGSVAQNHRWVMLENNMVAVVDPSSRRIVQVVNTTDTMTTTAGRDTTTTTTRDTMPARDITAGATTTQVPAADTFVTANSGNQWMASRLIGMAVYGPNNDRIGEIDDLLVDQSGRVVAAVVGVGGFLGIGEKNVAISFDKIKPSNAEGRDRLTIQFTKAELEAAPTFRRQNRT